MLRKDQNWLSEFLRNYQLELEFYEDFGKVKKVYTDNGVFAVKTKPKKSKKNKKKHTKLLI